MAKMVSVVHKRPDMDTVDFRRYWRETHGPIATEIPGLRKFIQSHASASPDGTDRPFDGLAELWFDEKSSLERAIASPEVGAAFADNKNVLDEERRQGFLVEEMPIISGD